MKIKILLFLQFINIAQSISGISYACNKIKTNSGVNFIVDASGDNPSPLSCYGLLSTERACVYFIFKRKETIHGLLGNPSFWERFITQQKSYHNL